jgi:hypothetical protein
MKSTTYPYHVVLVPKQNTKKGNESGINYPGELKKKTPDSSRGHKISTRNGSVIGSDVTYRFLEYWIALRKVCSFRKIKQKCPTPFNHSASPFYPRYISAFQQSCQLRYQPHPLVPSLAASTFPFGALSWRYRELKILNFKLGHYNV